MWHVNEPDKGNSAYDGNARLAIALAVISFFTAIAVPGLGFVIGIIGIWNANRGLQSQKKDTASFGLVLCSIAVLASIVSFFYWYQQYNTAAQPTRQESPAIQETSSDQSLNQCLDSVDKVFSEADYTNATIEEAKIIIDLRSRRIDECYRRYDR